MNKKNRIVLRITLKLLISKKLSSSLSILVLTFGMATFMLIFFFIKYLKSYDRTWKDADRIYRIVLEKAQPNGTVTTTATNYSGLNRVLVEEIPGVEYATGIQRDIVTAYTPDNFLKDADFFWCDTSFFKVFDRPFLCGDKENPFPTIQSAVISESSAIQLFGRKDPVGERFKLNEGWEFIVSGTFADMPENSHLKIDILITRKTLRYFIRNFDNLTSILKNGPVSEAVEPAPSAKGYWGNPNVYTYIKLRKNVDTENVIESFSSIYEKYTSHLIAVGQKSKFILQPVHSIHLDSHYNDELSLNSDIRTIIALYIIAILALSISWIIFINFQIIQSMERAKEAGLKKVAGATASDLLFQTILQSVIINTVGIVLAFLLFFSLRGELSNYLQVNDSIPLNMEFLLQIILIYILGAILTSLYPAYMLISKDIPKLLSEKFIKDNDEFNLRRLLIVFQFAASIGLMIASIVVVRQVNFLKKKDLGINISETMYSYTPMSMIKKEGANQKLVTFMEEVNRIPGMISATISSCIPGKEINFHSNMIYQEGNPEKKGDNFGILNIDYHFHEVFKPRVLAGRMFEREDKPGGRQVIINREACKRLGFESPETALEKYIQIKVSDYLSIPESPYQVCGIIEDFHQESPHKNIEPLLLLNDLHWKYEVGFISIRYKDPGKEKEIFPLLKEKWGKFYSADPFDFRFISENYDLQLRDHEKLAGLLIIYTFLSIILATLGLYGLAANATRKRSKEIGIRKVNGARISEIILMLNIGFIKWVLTAFILVVPVAWYIMNRWLENFAYKTRLEWWIFAASGILAITISLCAVIWQSWKAAIMNPVKALRYE